ncbi:YdbL family protein [Sphingomonas donggukensis]|uniref:YdbL family protein n=1 Tax=Sphingomonas donggukensis TaxID=2949093 RepID=A0ABY4TVU5_9SPHN|nr:YdbL family protein [Sphingomonas donggukensis]URW76000.1 YdbL family protein [Sphingomonas donggukensis]
MKTLHIAALIAVAAAGAFVATAAYAQRDPAYAAARASGEVGEQPDGYLGIVGSPTAALRALVNNINIQRKAAYAKQAGNGSTIEQFAFVSGCNLIAQTQPGEKYQSPTGQWMTRGAGAPTRDARCV